MPFSSIVSTIALQFIASPFALRTSTAASSWLTSPLAFLAAAALALVLLPLVVFFVLFLLLLLIRAPWFDCVVFPAASGPSRAWRVTAAARVVSLPLVGQ